MKVSETLRSLAEQVRSNYSNRDAIADGFALIADHIATTEPATLAPEDNPEAGQATGGAGLEG